MIAKNHTNLWQNRELSEHLILAPLLAPLCPIWIEQKTDIRKASQNLFPGMPFRSAKVAHKSMHVCFGGTGGTGHYFRMEPGYKQPKPVWRLITSTFCAGECYCQIGEPEVQEFESLAEAVRAFQKAEPEETLFREVGQTEARGTEDFAWFSRSGMEFAQECPFCAQEGGLHWTISLHCPEEATEATKIRLARVLGVRV